MMMKTTMAPINTPRKLFSLPKKLMLIHTLGINNNRKRRSWLLDNAVISMRKSQLRLTLLVLVVILMFLAMMLEIPINQTKNLTLHLMNNKNQSLILLKRQPKLVLQPFSVT
jgi:hypothetical protein